jgi:hypothetical protein
MGGPTSLTAAQMVTGDDLAAELRALAEETHHLDLAASMGALETLKVRLLQAAVAQVAVPAMPSEPTHELTQQGAAKLCPALLTDLPSTARRLSNDELRVFVTIAVRVRIGQSRYSRLRFGDDGRDFRRKAEDGCEGCFYAAAGLLGDVGGRPRPGPRARHSRG